MKQQAGDILIEMIIYGVLAAGILFAIHTAWSHFTGTYIAEGAAKQLKVDTVIVDNLIKDRDQWKKAAEDRQAETAACTQKADAQNLGIERINKQFNDAVMARKAIELAARKDAVQREATIAQLQAKASAPPIKDQVCEVELAKAKAILQDTLRARRTPMAVPK